MFQQADGKRTMFLWEMQGRHRSDRTRGWFEVRVAAAEAFRVGYVEPVSRQGLSEGALCLTSPKSKL